ncbi:cysteine desulfurase [Patescibacteria group bacterium]|nr:cysteine desulfurase [Patescibacteria group bacterium]
MRRIYLDYAASTPVAAEVFAEMKPYFSMKYGNPGSLHSFGQEAMAAVDKARERVARAINADFREVVFTGSATEANNLALRGVIRAARLIPRGAGRSSAPAAEADLRSRRARSFGDQAEHASESRRLEQSAPPNLNGLFRPKIIVSAVEHESVLETARDLERDGAEVVEAPVGKNGIVDLKKLDEVIDERTVLVSVMYVQNEIGSIQPVAEIARMIKRSGSGALFHADAAQAPAYLDCDVKKLGVDLMTLSSQKVYGPKGVGALYINGKAGRLLSPTVTGGGQEFGLRSGTENVPGIVGFGKAMELAAGGRVRSSREVAEIKDHFRKGLKKAAPKADVNGSSEAPHILNVYFPDQFAGDLLTRLDIAGVAASSGSACAARAFTPSHVLEAIGLPGERIRGSVRFSFGGPTTKAEVNEAVKRIFAIIRP